MCGRLRNEHTPEALAASSSSRRPSISDEADLRRLSEAIEEKTTADPEAAAAAPWGRTGSWLSGLASAITTSPEKPGEEVAQGA